MSWLRSLCQAWNSSYLCSLFLSFPGQLVIPLSHGSQGSCSSTWPGLGTRDYTLSYSLRFLFFRVFPPQGVFQLVDWLRYNWLLVGFRKNCLFDLNVSKVSLKYNLDYNTPFSFVHNLTSMIKIFKSLYVLAKILVAKSKQLIKHTSKIYQGSKILGWKNSRG